MKTKSTVGRLITHTMRVAAMLLLLVAGTNAVKASDWVLNEDKYSATHYTDHLYLEVFLADLDGKTRSVRRERSSPPMAVRVSTC